MRISDWSSDVCSSDLLLLLRDRVDDLAGPVDLLLVTVGPQCDAAQLEALGGQEDHAEIGARAGRELLRQLAGRALLEVRGLDGGIEGGAAVVEIDRQHLSPEVALTVVTPPALDAVGIGGHILPDHL